MRIGELSEKSGLSRDTIRFYERNGLITSTASESDSNNYREYSQEHLMWLGFLTGARDAGMSVADLQSIVAATAGSCDKNEARKIIHEKIQELKARADQIGKVVAFLETTLEG